MFWLALVAVLFAWKGSVCPGAVQIGRFLGMQAPDAAHFRWLGTGFVILPVCISPVTQDAFRARDTSGKPGRQVAAEPVPRCVVLSGAPGGRPQQGGC
jgi:hypothetical protein